MILQKIELFLFNLSVIYCIKYLIQFIAVLTQDNPTPIELGKVERVLLYLSASYIVTAIISFITT